MFELAALTPDTPLAYVAMVVLYNIIRHAIDKHVELKKAKMEAVQNQAIIELTKKLAAAEKELELRK